MSRDTEDRLAEVTKWYFEHERDGGDILKKLELQKKLNRCLLELLCRCLEDLRDLEGRPKEALGRRLWTPSGMAVTGDVRQFG